MCSLQIYVNGEAQETEARNVAELCAALGFAGTRAATALNGDFVPEAQRGGTVLHPGDHVEIVTPRQGG
jgi:sulfur carrier protein